MIDAIYTSSRSETVANTRSRRYGLERTFVAAMGGILYPIAQLLVTLPLEAGRNAAPTFGYYPFAAGAPGVGLRTRLSAGTTGSPG